MKVHIKGTGKAVDLTQRDFVGQGGEGVVYSKGGVAYKVYHDPARMLPIGKIQELGAIQDPCVVKPEHVLLDPQDVPVGYTTQFVPKAWTLCQLFPPSFRTREGVTPEMTQALIRKLQEHVVNIHKANILVVDLNEMNFLVTQDFGEVFCIDVDSYQTPHYAAPAIMESIRDWSVQGHKWTQLSDWFSFGVLSFQMFLGLHPFKGRYKGAHPEFKGKLPTDPDDDTFAVTRRRMAANISVLHPDVGVPQAAIPMSVIPKTYMAWFEALFAQGKRCPPPTEFGGPIIILPVIKTTSGTALLDILEIGSYEGTIIGVYGDGGAQVVVTDKGIWMNSTRVGDSIKDAPKVWSAIGFSPKGGRVIAAGPGHMKIPTLFNVTDRTQIPFNLQVEEVSSYDGRIYLRTNDRVHEVVLTDTQAQVIATSKEVAQTLPFATRLYQGVVVQRMLGTTFVSLLIRAGAAQQVQIKELDAYRVVDARFDRGVLMVVGEKHGQFDRLVFRVNEAGAYDMRVVPNVSSTGLNFVTLDSGVCVCLNEEDKLEVFSAKQGSTSIKYVEDSILSGDMILHRQGGTVLFSRGGKLYRMKMK